MCKLKFCLMAVLFGLSLGTKVWGQTPACLQAETIIEGCKDLLIQARPSVWQEMNMEQLDQEKDTTAYLTKETVNALESAPDSIKRYFDFCLGQATESRSGLIFEEGKVKELYIAPECQYDHNGWMNCGIILTKKIVK